MFQPVSLKKSCIKTIVVNDIKYDTVETPKTLQQECADKKYICCKVIKKIYSLMNKQWVPKQLTFSKSNSFRHGVYPNKINISPDVQNFLDKKKDNPQYVRTAIKHDHTQCLYELLRFDFDTYLALKTSIRFDRFYLISFFRDLAELFIDPSGREQWAYPLNYIYFSSDLLLPLRKYRYLKNVLPPSAVAPLARGFATAASLLRLPYLAADAYQLEISLRHDDDLDDLIKRGYIDDEIRESATINDSDAGSVHELAYAVLCGAHKSMHFMLDSSLKIEHDFREADVGIQNPLFLSIIKEDLYLTKMLNDKKCPLNKELLTRYINECSREKKFQIKEFLKKVGIKIE